MKKLLCFYLVLCVYASAAQNNPSPDLSFTPVPVSCNDRVDGMLIITNASPKVYSHQLIRTLDKSPVLANYTTELTIKELQAGSYSIISVYTETDGTQKTFTSKEINISDVPKLKVGTPQILSKPDQSHPNNGLAQIEVTGGTKPYSIQLTSPAKSETLGPFSSSPISITSLENNFYSIEVTDKNQCRSELKTLLVPKDLELSINPVTMQPTCSNASGKIQFSITGGTPPYKISYTNLTDNGLSSIISNDGNATILLTDYAKYSFSIEDSGAPAKTEKKFSPEIRGPNCNLSVACSTISSPSIANRKGGKVSVDVSGSPDYLVELIDENSGSLKSIKQYKDFPIANLSDGKYIVKIKDVNNAVGQCSFEIQSTYQTASEAKTAAYELRRRLVIKYCQIEIQRRRIKRAKNWIAAGWTAVTGLATVLSSGATSIATLGLNITGNCLAVFTNNANFEALTKASGLRLKQLDHKFITDPNYFGEWSYPKWEELTRAIDEINELEKEIAKISDMPDVKSYKEKTMNRIDKYREYNINSDHH